MDKTIIKRDGQKERYSPEKISRVAKAAGLSNEKTHQLVKDINEWITSNDKKELTSIELRDHVVMELTKLDTYAANMFIWYQKTKE